MVQLRMPQYRLHLLLAIAAACLLLGPGAAAQESFVREDLLDLYEIDAGHHWEELAADQLMLSDETPVEATQVGLELYMARRLPEERSLVQVMANDPIVETIIMCGDKAVPHLAGVAGDRNADEELRMVALFALGRIGGAEALKAVTPLRNDPAWRMRNRVVLALHDMGKADEIVNSLTDQHWNVRALAIRTLGALGETDAIIEFLKNDTKLVNDAGPNYIKYDHDTVVRWIAGHELQEKRFATDSVIESFLKAKGAEKVKWANVLGAFWDHRTRNALVGGLNDPDEAVRLACVDNLYKQGRYHELIDAIRNDNPNVQARAARHVGSAGDPLLIERLIPLLDDADEAAVQQVAIAILRLRQYGAKILLDGDPELPRKQKAWWKANKEKFATKDLAEIKLIAKPDLPDIDLGYIGRTPRYDFDAEKNNPAPGDEVTFTAHIKNAGTKPTGAFKYAWFIDGEAAGSGTVDSLEPGATTTVAQTWTWQTGPHTVKCVLDADDAVREISELNNALEDKTNAFIAALWVEKTRYGIYNDEQFYLNIGSNSWEDWAQRQMRNWNFGFERSISVLTPEGVVDRVRLDKVTLVDDDALPLVGNGPPGNMPDASDKTADVVWGFDTAKLDNEHFYNTNYEMFAYKEGSLPHEMSHARYLIDLYGVGIRGEDIDVAGSFGRRDYDRFSGIEHHAWRGVMMASGYFWGYSDHSAAALNRRLNVRAEHGNVNASADLGEYLDDLPAKSTFRVVDVNGEPVPGAVVLVYRSVTDPRPWGERTAFYDMQIDNAPDMVVQTNPDGLFTIEGSPFGGRRIKPYLGNSVVLFKVKLGEDDFNHIMDVTDFNVAYWNGGRREARFTIAINVSNTNPHTPSHVRVERTESGADVLRWEGPAPIEPPRGAPPTLKPTPAPTPAYYRVYRHVRGQQWELVRKTIYMELPLGGAWDAGSTYAVSAVSLAQHESARIEAARPAATNASQVFTGYDDTRHLLEPGRIITTDSRGVRLGQMTRWIEGATAMASGPGGRIYLAATTWEEQNENDEPVTKTGIVVVGPSAELVERYGVAEGDRRALKEPRGMIVNAQGRIIVADTGNARVLVLKADGSFEQELKAPRRGRNVIPVAVAAAPAGQIAVAYQRGDSGLIAFYGPDGTLERTRIEDLAKPVGLAVAPDGRVVVAEAGASRVRVFAFNEKKNSYEAVRTITEYAGEPLGAPTAVALDRFMRIVVARAGRAPAVFDPPTDFTVRIVPHEGRVHKIAPNKCTIYFTNISDTRFAVGNVSSRIGLFGAARQADLDKRDRFWLSPGETRNIDATIAFPVDERRGILPAEFYLKTHLGDRYAYTTVEVHDLIEHRVVAEKQPVGERDRWERHKGSVLVTSYYGRPDRAMLEVTAEPRVAGIQTRFAEDGYVIAPLGTTVLPFEVLVPLDSTGLRAQVTCRLVHVGQSYLSGFDIVRPIPWRMIGPFDNADNAGFTTAYPPEEKVEINGRLTMPDGTTLRWVTVPNELYDEKNGVFFHEHFDDPEWKAAYVTNVVSCPEDRDVLLKVGSDDQIVIWVNGEEVHRHDVARGAEPDQDTVKAKLRKGNNRILIKICNGVGGWGFYFRFTNPDGNVYYDLRAGADADWNPEDE